MDDKMKKIFVTPKSERIHNPHSGSFMKMDGEFVPWLALPHWVRLERVGSVEIKRDDGGRVEVIDPSAKEAPLAPRESAKPRAKKSTKKADTKKDGD